MHSDTEAVLLAGGASRRMGRDKATLIIDGVPQALRIAGALAEQCACVTVLGSEPLEGYAFLPDSEAFKGPLAALSRFRPKMPYVFVASCDLPLFDGRLVSVLRQAIGDKEAAAPRVNCFVQPLCALYRASAFASLGEAGCATDWISALDHGIVESEALASAGIDPDSAQGANTPEELGLLLDRRPTELRP